MIKSEFKYRSPLTQTSAIKRTWLWFELFLIYGFVPGIIAGLVRPEKGNVVLDTMGISWFRFGTGLPRGLFIFPALLLTFLIMFLMLYRDPTFDNRRFWNIEGFRTNVRKILIGITIAGPLILFTSWILATHTTLLPAQGFLYLPREQPILMLAIMLFYPWISAYPQEMTHRAFLFHRYQPIIGSGFIAMSINIVAFAWLHAPMWNLIAILMTIPAGALFAWTYRRSNSVLAAGFEHAIYGIWVFFTGLGYFVYAGR